MSAGAAAGNDGGGGAAKDSESEAETESGAAGAAGADAAGSSGTRAVGMVQAEMVYKEDVNLLPASQGLTSGGKRRKRHSRLLTLRPCVRTSS